MANLLYGAIDTWRKQAVGTTFKAPLAAHKPGTMKKVSDAVTKKSHAVITITFSGTVSEVEAAIQEYAKGRK